MIMISKESMSFFTNIKNTIGEVLEKNNKSQIRIVKLKNILM